MALLPAGSAHSEKHWNAGYFSFSDELGGIEILSVSGLGTKKDPITIRQRFYGPASATLTIRTLPFSVATKMPRNPTHSSLHVRIETVNHSPVPWIGFGFELQEIQGVASDFGDGLSFDQLSRQVNDILSDRFQQFEDQFEPADRLVYTDGHVNVATSVTTRFIITDLTPVDTFYLYQEPLVPAS